MKKIELRKPEYYFQADLYAPDTVTDDLPFLIFLHGAGERGTNIDHVYRHGLAKLIHDGLEVPAYVLCPQCPGEYVWNTLVRELKEFIDILVEKYAIKKDRICITGGSMGGFGTWEMGVTYPSFFSAIAPVCGGGMSWRGSNLVKTPVKAYHGTADTIVPIVYSELMVENINQCGGHAELVRMEGLNHEQGINLPYSDTDLLDWILAQRRGDFSRVKENCEEMF